MKEMLHRGDTILRKTIGYAIFKTILLCSLIAIVLSSCGDDEITQSDKKDAPITFASSQQEEQSVTRADSPLAHDFTVWGYKKAESGDVQKVFQGYTVRYVDGTGGSSVDNTHGYSYVDEEHNQSIKYWDFFAHEYNFWGYTGDKSDFGTDGTTLTISGLAQSVTEPVVDDRLFSALYHRAPPSRDVVRLQFKRPYAKVRVMFYCSEKLESGDQVEIGASTFGPEATGQIITGATLKVMYSQSGDEKETYLTESIATSDKLNFGGVALTHLVGTASNNAALAVPDGGTDYYYVIPNVYGQEFVLTTTIDGDEKDAIVPAALMHWLPNYTYTYLFKITEAGKKIEFYDVKIDPWKYGGSQENEWKNW